MTSDWCYKCPRCESFIELEGEELNHGDGEETELECPNCGQKVKCTTYVSVDYKFSVKDPVNEDRYNVGVELHRMFGKNPTKRENYIPHLEDKDEWEDINRILTEQEGEE